ncbi:MAG TPA: hypothetical protein VGJ51_14815 [Candidatus Angelobacter sp.]|jgi:hypothetical protein
MPVVEAPVAHDISDLSTKLHQLRRLRAQPGEQPASWHLNSALQAAEHKGASKTKLDAGVFIGIIIDPNQTGAKS